MSTINLGNKQINPRVTAGKLRKLKLEEGVDLTSSDPQVMLDFAVDPLVVTQVSYNLFKEQLGGMTQEQFEDTCGPDEVEQLRTEVVQQMKVFSSFWKILSTEMEGLLSGDTSLVDLASKMKAVEASGRSS